VGLVADEVENRDRQSGVDRQPYVFAAEAALELRQEAVNREGDY
jgi:hypothetical protein